MLKYLTRVGRSKFFAWTASVGTLLVVFRWWSWHPENLGAPPLEGYNFNRAEPREPKPFTGALVEAKMPKVFIGLTIPDRQELILPKTIPAGCRLTLKGELEFGKEMRHGGAISVEFLAPIAGNSGLQSHCGAGKSWPRTGGGAISIDVDGPTKKGNYTVVIQNKYPLVGKDPILLAEGKVTVQ